MANSNCDCWERGVDYNGADIAGNNPSFVRNAGECQGKCQARAGCSHWTYQRRRGGGETRCWLKSSGFRRQENSPERLSGNKFCGSGGGGGGKSFTSLIAFLVLVLSIFYFLRSFVPIIAR